MLHIFVSHLQASTIHFVPFDETAEVEFSGPCLPKSLTRINAIEPQQVYDIFVVGNTTEANVVCKNVKTWYVNLVRVYVFNFKIESIFFSTD